MVHSPPASVLRQVVYAHPLGMADDEDLLSLSPGLLDWIHKEFGEHHIPSGETVRRLSKAFSAEGRLALQYDDLGVYGASGTFLNRSGNCLSFTNLFVAVGRYLGMRVRYRDVMQAPEWSRVGDFAVRSRHVVAYVESGGLSFEVDFGGRASSNETILTKIISDKTARAQHFNNLGVLAMTEERTEAAIRYLNRAIDIEPELPYLWSNLGTIYMRLGDYRRAEWTFRESFRLDPYDVSALGALVRLYQALDVPELVEHFVDRLKFAKYRNPYAEYERGVSALMSNEYEEAAKHLKAASRRLSQVMQVHMRLGEAYFYLEEFVLAEKSWREALERSQTAEEEAELSTKLQQLIIATSSRTESSQTP